MRITYDSISERGERSQNEDYVGLTMRDGVYCFVLCDGLGGHGLGNIASKFVTEAVIAYFNEHEYSDHLMADAINHAQESLLELQKEYHEEWGMKTTLSILIIDDQYARWGYSGDSRVYLFKKGKYQKRTIDHSVPQMLALAGSIREKDIRHHPDRNKLLKSLGVDWAKPQYSIGDQISLKKGQQFLLCSDGFWEYITEKEMRKCFKRAQNVNDWLAGMSKIVAINGMKSKKKADNYSAIAIWIGDK